LLTLTVQPHKKIWFSEIFFWILNMFAIVSSLQKKILIFIKIDDFFYLLWLKLIYYQVQNFFAEKLQKIKENFISLRIMFLINKKRVNWSNNIVKTKKCTISIEIGIFCTFLKSCFNMRYLTVIIIKLFFYCIFNLWWYLVI